MKVRNLGRLLMAAALLASGAVAKSKSAPALPQTDQQIASAVRHQIAMYPYYSIFDDVSFTVVQGQVTLSGDVTQPVQKSDIGRLVQQVPGVTSLANNLQVLPLSDFDNRLRVQIARAVYRNPVLSRYAGVPVAPIHIIVNHGHVTLVGTVATNMEKQVAGMAANTGLSFGPVTNNLVVENPAKSS